jgi:hypothetical protein
MRGMGCMTYHGEEDAKVAGLWLEKKGKELYIRYRCQRFDSFFIEG